MRDRPDEFGARGFATARADAGDYRLRRPAKGTGGPYVSTGRFPDVPVPVLNGDLDGVTAEANGRTAAAQFPRGAFAAPGRGTVRGIRGQTVRRGTQVTLRNKRSNKRKSRPLIPCPSEPLPVPRTVGDDLGGFVNERGGSSDFRLLILMCFGDALPNGTASHYRA